MDESCPRNRRRGTARTTTKRSRPKNKSGRTRILAGVTRLGSNRIWLLRRFMDLRESGPGDRLGVWSEVPQKPRLSSLESSRLDPAKTFAARSAPRRRRSCVVAERSLAGTQKKARRESRVIVCVDEAAFYLLPGVVRTYAPRGETPLLKALLTRSHLSVMSGVT